METLKILTTILLVIKNQHFTIQLNRNSFTFIENKISKFCPTVGSYTYFLIDLKQEAQDLRIIALNNLYFLHISINCLATLFVFCGWLCVIVNISCYCINNYEYNEKIKIVNYCVLLRTLSNSQCFGIIFCKHQSNLNER